MPQLDKLIVLPQIFWLIILFTLFYFITTFYFLPILISGIKSKKYFLESNLTFNTNLTTEIFSKRKILMSCLIKDFLNTKNLIFGNIISLNFCFKNDPFKHKHIKSLDLILLASINSIFYCNISLLKSLKFLPLILNKK